jgi:hypothetical protein
VWLLGYEGPAHINRIMGDSGMSAHGLLHSGFLLGGGGGGGISASCGGREDKAVEITFCALLLPRAMRLGWAYLARTVRKPQRGGVNLCWFSSKWCAIAWDTVSAIGHRSSKGDISKSDIDSPKCARGV